MKTFSMLCFIILAISACGKQGARQYASTTEASTTASMAKIAADSVTGNVGSAEQRLTEITEPKQPNNSEPIKYIALRHH